MCKLRQFFDSSDFHAVETSVLQVMPCADVHIHGFKTALKNHDLSHARDLYLQTSPEFAMKKLLVAGMDKIYQICPVFRNAEGSRLHSPEFTIVEWYRSGADYTAIMDDCVALLQSVSDEYRFDGHVCDPHAQWEKITVCEAFAHYAGIDLALCLNELDAFKECASSIGVRAVAQDQWDDVFHAVMAAKIEPNLGQGAPTILYDYPVCLAALARRKPDDTRFAERFELYVCGVELANAFSELTDDKEQRARFEADMALKAQLYGEQYPLDEEFLAALELGMPEAAGIALGVDRLIMLATGAEDISQVLWAPI